MAPARALHLLLANVPGDEISVENVDPHPSARVARSAAFEPRAWFALQERARYPLPMFPGGPIMEEVIDLDRRALRPLPDGTQALTVRAPLPIDPRRVADTIHDCL